MVPAKLPKDEAFRLQSLLNYNVLDTAPEQAFDDLAAIAAHICGTPIALVSLIDSDRQWFKAKVGLDATETPRDLAFCAHAILQDDIFIVENATQHPDFADNPLVTSDPNIHFYAGMPLITHNNHKLGTLCVIDIEPKQLSKAQITLLKALSRQVVNQLELRIKNYQLEEANAIREKLIALISHDLYSSFNVITGFSAALRTRTNKASAENIANVIAKIESASKRAHNILLGILDWSKAQLQTGHLDPQVEYESIELYALVQSVMSDMADIASPKRITLKLEGAETACVATSRSLLRSTIQNLLANAIKFSHEAGSVLCVIEQKQTGVMLTVSDKGVGMEAETVAKVFRSSEFHTSYGTQGERGAGVGTLLIRDFVQSYKVNLEVFSEKDKGTSVSLFFTVDTTHSATC